MTSRMNPNINPTQGESFTDQFNENVDYTRDKTQATTTGMGQGQQGPNLAQSQAEAEDQAARGNQRATEAQTSIDSTNAGVDHRRTSYSFTAATLSHPDERTGLGPEE
ncbi:hypothetical protein BDW62DRAFT_188327 [Aspergillus aurantiobrunneus]